jgi:hypothetical protein
MTYNVGDEKELYEDWKPLLEGQRDDITHAGPDLESEAQEHMVEQTSYGPGVSAGGPGDDSFPLWEKPPDRLAGLVDEVEDW